MAQASKRSVTAIRIHERSARPRSSVMPAAEAAKRWAMAARSTWRDLVVGEALGQVGKGASDPAVRLSERWGRRMICGRVGVGECHAVILIL